ncbi:MAG: hypothetical protein FJ145_13365 [Deltaproteobacteria bacterium]|nr:hypothetical protein [Deltaproteobacteria bacterium]
MIQPIGLTSGHYECRSLAETLPVLTDLLAMTVEHQADGIATLKHPNTAWRLIVHEGGAAAPEKTFDNHYGFRVDSHKEVAAAWQYIDAHKDQYRLSKITKPQKAHFAYSIYFLEPGGNHLEIEYYNPGGSLHGRSHTAGHWENPLSSEQFPNRGYVPQALTHGTLQCDDAEKTKNFHTQVLGLELAGGMNEAVYIKHAATPWYIVMLARSARQYLAPVNRFTLQLASAEAVERANQEFTRRKSELAIHELGKVEDSAGRANFIFSDLDKNWWELTS